MESGASDRVGGRPMRKRSSTHTVASRRWGSRSACCLEQTTEDGAGAGHAVYPGYCPLLITTFATPDLAEECRSSRSNRSSASGSKQCRWTRPRSRCTRMSLEPYKNGPQSMGKSRGGWNTKVHMVAADARTTIAFALSPGHAHDAPEGRGLLWEPSTDAGRPSPADGSSL
jgi:hypothetical protein